ncbi:hypothetical protein AAC387_Pa03g1148 [Persea americana]
MSHWVSVTRPQRIEIAIGLRASGVSFLWVVPGSTVRLQEASGEIGLVVPWCDQLRVLCHSFVGGFVTHCGWNSTMEGIYAGVPMLTFPISFNQIPNAKLIVEDWKIGLRVKQEIEGKIVVRRQEIARIVKRLMDLDEEESNELRKRAVEMKEICKRAIEKEDHLTLISGLLLKKLCKVIGINQIKALVSVIIFMLNCLDNFRGIMHVKYHVN